MANCGAIGCIAGPDGCLVKLHDAVKKPWPDMSIPGTDVIPSESIAA